MGLLICANRLVPEVRHNSKVTLHIAGISQLEVN